MLGVRVVLWELAVPADLREHVLRAGLQILGLNPGHALAAGRLPLHHRNPFDRLLVAQARSEGLTLVTADERIARYDVCLIDAAT